MSVRVSGIVKSVRAVHRLKALSPMADVLSEKFMFFRLLQPEKAYLLMTVFPSEKVTSVRAKQSWKAP